MSAEQVGTADDGGAARREWPPCTTWPRLNCVCRGALNGNPTSGYCQRASEQKSADRIERSSRGHVG